MIAQNVLDFGPTNFVCRDGRMCLPSTLECCEEHQAMSSEPEPDDEVQGPSRLPFGNRFNQPGPRR